jgi:hypothetical protein
LFAEDFNTNNTQNPYQESDNFCFYCHSDSSGQQVVNRSYSATFGGGNFATGPQSIMAAFNQSSYHNLNDIRTFLTTDPTYAPWFANFGNPCSACHDSHLAKRNWDSLLPGFPLLSTISKPGGAGIRTLWGEGSQVMSAYLSYEAPYSSGINVREPADVGVANGDNTPDYVSFCSSCHNTGTSITSTTLARELKKINWDSNGLNQDKHGDLSRDGTDSFREPYATAALSKSNFVLSCLDCHESHGSENIMMLRTRINGEDQEDIVSSTDAMSYTCKRCHNDDLSATTVLGSQAGTGEANRWEYVHHGVADAPYGQSLCETCHATPAGDTAIACGNCHGHGMDDNWLGASASGRKTF